MRKAERGRQAEQRENKKDQQQVRDATEPSEERAFAALWLSTETVEDKKRRERRPSARERRASMEALAHAVDRVECTEMPVMRGVESSVEQWIPKLSLVRARVCGKDSLTHTL
jgi:hypothetical protein